MTPRIRKVLHLLGSEEDTGGVLSVIRNVGEVAFGSGWKHVSLVHESFKETRQPPLDLRRSRHLIMEHPDYAVFLQRAVPAWRDVRRLVREEKVEILHAHSRGPMLVAMLASLADGPPAIFANHAFARQKWYYRVASRWPGLVSTILSPNMGLYYGIAPEPGRVEIISECCSNDFFARPLPTRRNPSRGVRMKLVGMGNLVRWKKWDIVIRALALLPMSLRETVQFELWGPTPSDADSQSFARELRSLTGELALPDSVVRFAGPTLSVADVLQSSDGFVLPSTNEPCSVALIEALALGIPTFVTASGGNVDILRSGRTGCLFQPESAQDLAVHLAAWLTGSWTPAPPAEIRESVRERSATAVGRQYVELYERILRNRGEY